jgi:acyl carrier protein
VLVPKVRGTQVLERLLADEPLDFLVLCSSLATAVTAVGQVDYFAANAYLDAWAQARRAGAPSRPGRHTVAIGWDAWREAGMAVDTDVPEAMRAGREQALKLGLSDDEGRDALLRVLGAPGLAHVLVSTRALGARIEEHERELAIADEQAGPTAASAAGEPDGRAGAYARPELSTEYRRPETGTETRVAQLWADLLGLDRVGADDSFFELGGNSLLLMQLSVRLKSLFGVVLPVKVLFDTPTVVALAERVDAVRALAGGDAGAPAGGDQETEELAL